MQPCGRNFLLKLKITSTQPSTRLQSSFQCPISCGRQDSQDDHKLSHGHWGGRYFLQCQRSASFQNDPSRNQVMSLQRALCNDITWFLKYAASHPHAKICFSASDMILHIASDGSYIFWVKIMQPCGWDAAYFRNQVMSLQRGSVGFDCCVARFPRATNIVRSKAIP